MVQFLKLVRNSKGATAIEYALVASLIAIAAIAGFQSLGAALNTTFNEVESNI